MSKRQAGVTLFELLLGFVILIILVGIFLPALARARDEGRKTQCISQLEQIGRAMGAYYGHYQERYPFFKSQNPDGISGEETGPKWAGVDAYIATDSLTLLYPEFLTRSDIFGCPNTNDTPQIAVTFWKVHANDPTTPQTEPAGGWVALKRLESHFGERSKRNEAHPRNTDHPDFVPGKRAESGPRWSSYGYNNRIHPTRTGWTHIIAGDMDHTAAVDLDSRTANHQGGGNYLHFDGSVRFQRTNYASNHPEDHIFRPQGDLGWRENWGADTDVWLRRP